MKIWADREKKIPLSRIHFGKVEVGSEKTLTVYLENDTKAILSNLQYNFSSLPSTEVLEVHGPSIIQSGTIEPLILKWKPSPSFKKALTVDLLIKGEEIYMASENIS